MFKLLRLFVKHFRKSNLVNLLKFIQMNTKKMGVLSGLMLVFLSLSSFTTVLDFQPSIHAVEVQDGLVVYAAYSGKDDAGYNFVAKDRNGDAQTVTFQGVNDGVLVAFNLNDASLIDVNFKITFNKGLDASQEETNTITALEKL